LSSANTANTVLLRDRDRAARFVLESLWLQRVVPVAAPTVRPVLEWAMEIASSGQPLPPLALVGDFGYIAFGSERESRLRANVTVPGLPPGLNRIWEDALLGKLYADRTFERAGDALRGYRGRDRARGLAYVVRQFMERGGIGGVDLPPGVIRELLGLSPDEVLRRGWESLSNDGPMPLVIEQMQAIVAAARRMAEVLDAEDVTALEQRTALADMGQYVAHRQILQMSRRLEEMLPRQKVRPLPGRPEVPTRVFDEDTYPVGGFTSISTRGSIESLLHSQLAYMEPVKTAEPDLFDMKFLRDELYYYSRDENQFLRRRRTFVLILDPSLVTTRFKDAELPCQRIVLVLSMLLSATRKIIDWLSSDALRIEFIFPTDGTDRPLAQEALLLETLLLEPIAAGTVAVEHLAPDDLLQHCETLAARTMCHCLAVSTTGMVLEPQGAVCAELRVDGPRPAVSQKFRGVGILEADDSVECWGRTLEYLLTLWV